MDILFSLFLGTPVWMWVAFITLVLALLAFDLGVLNKGEAEIGVRESLRLSALYIALGVAFGGFVWWQMGVASAAEYMTAFVVEKSLALDNIFVIALIFSFFAIPRAYQHRVLFWGILGVIVLRAIMIGVGATLVAQYSWVLYLFAGFLILTGIKMLLMGEKETHLEDNPLLKLMRRFFHVTDGLRGNAFMVRLADLGLPPLVRDFDKTYLSVPRLAHALALIYLMTALPVVKRLSDSRWCEPLAQMGRMALPVFALGTILSFAVRAVKAVVSETLAADSLLIGGGLLVMWAFAYVREKARAAAAMTASRPERIGEPALRRAA